LQSVARRIVDRSVLHLIKMWLDCPLRSLCLNPPMTVASCPVASASAAKGKTLRQGYRRIRCGKQYGH
jgi:hypothetical protein